MLACSSTSSLTKLNATCKITGTIVEDPIVPRPVDSKLRAELGYPDPRDAEQILFDISHLDKLMRPIIEQNDVWKKRFREYRAMQRKRISFISELEESGYDGPQMSTLLLTQLKDINDVSGRIEWPWSAFGDLRRKIAGIFPGEVKQRDHERNLFLFRNPAQLGGLFQAEI